jgi:hypothetical protein
MTREREELLGKISQLIAAADCYCVTYPVPNEHVVAVCRELKNAGYFIPTLNPTQSGGSTYMSIYFDTIALEDLS